MGKFCNGAVVVRETQAVKQRKMQETYGITEIKTLYKLRVIAKSQQNSG
jgi:hypothetical protein